MIGSTCGANLTGETATREGSTCAADATILAGADSEKTIQDMLLDAMAEAAAQIETNVARQSPLPPHDELDWCGDVGCAGEDEVSLNGRDSQGIIDDGSLMAEVLGRLKANDGGPHYSQCVDRQVSPILGQDPARSLKSSLQKATDESSKPDEGVSSHFSVMNNKTEKRKLCVPQAVPQAVPQEMQKEIQQEKIQPSEDDIMFGRNCDIQTTERSIGFWFNENTGFKNFSIALQHIAENECQINPSLPSQFTAAMLDRLLELLSGSKFYVGMKTRRGEWTWEEATRKELYDRVRAKYQVCVRALTGYNRPRQHGRTKRRKKNPSSHGLQLSSKDVRFDKPHHPGTAIWQKVVQKHASANYSDHFTVTKPFIRKVQSDLSPKSRFVVWDDGKWRHAKDTEVWRQTSRLCYKVAQEIKERKNHPKKEEPRQSKCRKSHTAKVIGNKCLDEDDKIHSKSPPSKPASVPKLGQSAPERNDKPPKQKVEMAHESGLPIIEEISLQTNKQAQAEVSIGDMLGSFIADCNAKNESAMSSFGKDVLWPAVAANQTKAVLEHFQKVPWSDVLRKSADDPQSSLLERHGCHTVAKRMAKAEVHMVKFLKELMADDESEE